MGGLSLFTDAFILLQSLRGIDYIVKDKIFFESLLDAEFEPVIDKGFFYNGRYLIWLREVVHHVTY